MIPLTVALIQKILSKMSYLPESYSHNKKKLKAELDLSNYATKPDLTNATGVDTSNLLKKLSKLT